MEIAMITADIKTEAGRGIAVYTQELTEAFNKNRIRTQQLFYNLGSIRSFIKLFPEFKKYAILHIQHEGILFGKFAGIKFIPLILLLSIFVKKKKVVTMHTVHSKNDELFPKIWLWTLMKKKIIYPIQNKWISRFADAIVVHSDHLAKILVDEYRVKKDKIYVIPHGVKKDVESFSKHYAKNKLGIKGKLYLMIGNISYNKGFDIIVNQAKEIGKNILIFGQSLGSEAYLNRIKKEIMLNHLEKCVKIDTKIDPVGKNFKKWELYLSAADIVLLPYRNMTTSGIFISAMQFRKPVVASNSIYFNQIASKYGCLKIAKKNSEYPFLIKDSLRDMKKMEKEAERFVSDVNLDIISKKYKQMYKKIKKL